MSRSLCVVWTICLLYLGSRGVAGDSEQQQGSWGSKQTGTCTTAGSKILTHVSAAVLPAHGCTPEEAAQDTHNIATTIAPLCTSMVAITPAGSEYHHTQTKSAPAEQQSIPAVLHHHIRWTADASAAITEAAEVAHSNGAAWLLLVRTGDQIRLLDSDVVLKQLQGACSDAQMLACHQDEHSPEAQACLFRLPLRGHFEGPTTPVFVPHTDPAIGEASSLGNKHSISSQSTSKRSSEDNVQLLAGSQHSKGGSCRTTPAASAPCPEVTQDQSNCISIHGMYYQPAEPAVHHLRSRVDILRKHLRTQPSNKAWWLYQLAEAYELLGKTEQAAQHYTSSYEASTSRRLAAAAMYRVAELCLASGDFKGSIAAVSKGLARHATPDLLWIASLAAYRSAQYKSAVNWAEMASQLSCASESGCDVDRPAAFVDVSTWYEKPYDVLRYAYEQLQGKGDAAQKAQSDWEAAELLREQEVNGANNSRFVVLGLQALALMSLPEDLYVPPQLPSKPRIALSITTAHRPHLFTRTWYSFRSRCLDCNQMIDKWYAVDDGSAPEDLAVMQQAAAPCMLTWLDKTADAAGHVGSLNRILDEVLGQGFEYLLHLEDDWYFIAEDELVSKALRIMQHDSSISQVLFNQDFADTDWEREMVASGEARMTADGLQYSMHVFSGPKGSKEHFEYASKHAQDKLSNFHWPGFSLRPGLWRLSAFQQMGKFVATPRFEEVYASKLHEAGFNTAFMRGSACIHLAPTATWLQEREADINAMYARHGLSLQHSAHRQHSAYDSNVAWR